MAELISCRVCRKPVSSSANICPHCGDRSPEPYIDTLKYGFLGFITILIIVLLFAGVIIFIF